MTRTLAVQLVWRSDSFFACPGHVVAHETCIVKELVPTIRLKVIALMFTLVMGPTKTVDCPEAGQGVAVGAGRGVGVLCSVVAVAIAPGSVVAVESSALTVFVGSVFVREFPA